MAQHAEANADAKLAGRTIVEAAPQAARTVTRETGRQGAREVFGYMGVAVVFALIGNEIRQAKHGKGTTSPGTLSESGVIIFGGFTAAAALTLISHAGDGGRQFAVGLAAVTMVSSVLVYGGDVWKALGAATGQAKRSTPTTPSSPNGFRQSNPTPATSASQPMRLVA